MDTDCRIDRAFFERATDEVAADLIGCTLATHKDAHLTSGRIVETEAYGGPADLASHAAIYQSTRTAIMSGAAGIAYVYRSYGIHACFNVVARMPGSTGAVLIRALEPRDGIELMERRRGLDQPKLLCSGPGRLAQALGIALSDCGLDVVACDSIVIYPGDGGTQVVATTRVGITREMDRPWRFVDARSRFLSRPAPKASDASMGP